MPDLMRVKRDILLECAEDHVGLWEIIWQLQEVDHVADPAERRRVALEIVRDLLLSGSVQAGFPTTDGSGFDPWAGTLDEIMSRIENEWDELGHEPGIGEIVWFTTT